MSRYDSSDRNACEVLNTECLKLKDIHTTGIDDITDGETMRIEGRELSFPGGFSRLEVYDAAGNLIRCINHDATPFSLDGCGKGLYILRVTAGSGMKTLKITL